MAQSRAGQNYIGTKWYGRTVDLNLPGTPWTVLGWTNSWSTLGYICNKDLTILRFSVQGPKRAGWIVTRTIGQRINCQSIQEMSAGKQEVPSGYRNFQLNSRNFQLESSACWTAGKGEMKSFRRYRQVSGFWLQLRNCFEMASIAASGMVWFEKRFTFAIMDFSQSQLIV